MQALWAIIVAVVLAGRLIAAEPVEWKVVSVHDGNTLTLLVETPDRKRMVGVISRVAISSIEAVYV